ncbi:MAG: hypothetical protein HYY60_02260, partial [Parcubacteria group bacterium]|nr:hypothetical protein [Parcubacteria group bacterium]
LIGVVGAVETSSSDAFQDIVFQAPLNLYEIQWVEVLVNSGYIEEGVKPSP